MTITRFTVDPDGYEHDYVRELAGQTRVRNLGELAEMMGLSTSAGEARRMRDLLVDEGFLVGWTESDGGWLLPVSDERWDELSSRAVTPTVFRPGDRVGSKLSTAEGVVVGQARDGLGAPIPGRWVVALTQNPKALAEDQSGRPAILNIWLTEFIYEIDLGPDEF